MKIFELLINKRLISSRGSGRGLVVRVLDSGL